MNLEALELFDHARFLLAQPDISQETLEVLECMKDLLARPERWTQHVDARTQDGIPVEPRSVTAHQWCLIGALRRSAENAREDTVRAIEYILRGLVMQEEPAMETIWEYNDAPRRSHEDIVRILDRAIARARRDARETGKEGTP